MNTVFPSRKLYMSVCDNGLSVVRPLASSNAEGDVFGWNYGSASPPSYWAYGRLRALITMARARGLLDLAAGSRVLEVAAGDAALSACLAKEGHNVTANDLREENLRASVANFNNAADIRLLPGNLFDLDPASAGTFDLVIGCEIVEHVAHTVDFLKQLKRFLAPGGRVLLTTPNGAYFRNKLPTYSEIDDFTALEKEQFKPDSDGHLFLITPREMEGIAKSAGFVVDDITVWGTPFVTGESGFRYLSPLLPLTGWYALERLARRFGSRALDKLGNSMCVVLSAPDAR
jgi:2-polyprenyl-3-methyl-5-hydroxy-6-metoxy-1,4-benzoquinol methylase